MTHQHSSPDDPQIPQMTVTELAQAMRGEGGTPGQHSSAPLRVLDVRREDERQIARIEGTEHVPLEEVLADPAGVAERLDLGEGPVAVHCLLGGRSQRAAEALAAVGVQTVNVAGGIRAWSQEVDPQVPIY